MAEQSIPTPPLPPIDAATLQEIIEKTVKGLGWVPAPTQISDYTFWINVSLATATLSMTLLTVVIAVLAFVGYQSSTKIMRSSAQKFAATETDKYLRGEAFQASVRSVISEVMEDQIKNRIYVVERTSAPAPAQTEARTVMKDE